MRPTSTNAGFALKFPYFAVRLSCARQVSAALACMGQDGAVLLTEAVNVVLSAHPTILV